MPQAWTADTIATADSPVYTADGSGPGIPVMMVQAVAAGFYRGDYKDIGDVFGIFSPFEFSDSTQSIVPVGDPDYPVYGWMLQVAYSTPPFSWAAYGNSSPRNAPRRTVL